VVAVLVSLSLLAASIPARAQAPPVIPAGCVAATEQSAAPGEPGYRVVDTRTGVEFVWVPAGRFRMGSDREELEQLWRANEWSEAWLAYTDDEVPSEEVEVAGFWIARYEVTQDQYARFLRDMLNASPLAPAQPLQPRLPVTLVSFREAAAFCAWAGMSLPTEVQWEYAARGPESRIFPWGNEWDRTRCNSAEAHAGRPLRNAAEWAEWAEGALGAAEMEQALLGAVPVPLLADVGSYPAGDSWCGAADMAGNVWEWCADRYTARRQVEERRRGEAGLDEAYRVLRGGSALAKAPDCRGAERGRGNPFVHAGIVGFRPVKAAEG